jgi:UDP-3-O-[3-hydroxymyristoyl] N-acetylglucosamine deacetylase
MLQTTIRNPVSCYGIAVHTGQKVQLTLKPAKEDQGIVFVRKDISYGENHIQADYFNVSETSLCTKISNQNNISVSTIEHLMAAIWGSGIDNVIIEVDGPEVPIMDGSSKPFVFMIECAGTKILCKYKKILVIKRDIEIDNGKGSYALASPSEEFGIDLEIEFESKLIGRQNISYSDRNKFDSEVASARTFGFIHELEYLKSKGLARGASLDNAIGLDNDKILNHDGLRYEDEFVRHKLLDAIGDFSLSSINIAGKFNCTKPGHEINNQLLRKLFSDTNNFDWR